MHMRAPPPNGTNVLARGTCVVVIDAVARGITNRQMHRAYLAKAIGIELLRLGPELGVSVKVVRIDKELSFRWDYFALELRKNETLSHTRSGLPMTATYLIRPRCATSVAGCNLHQRGQLPFPHVPSSVTYRIHAQRLLDHILNVAAKGMAVKDSNTASPTHVLEFVHLIPGEGASGSTHTDSLVVHALNNMRVLGHQVQGEAKAVGGCFLASL